MYRKLRDSEKVVPRHLHFFNHCFVLSLFDFIRHSGQSKFHWRRQSQEGRISTVEAAALVLEELGQSGDGDALRNALAILMDALGRQCHHDSWRLKTGANMKKLKKGAAWFDDVWRGLQKLFDPALQQIFINELDGLGSKSGTWTKIGKTSYQCSTHGVSCHQGGQSVNTFAALCVVV